MELKRPFSMSEWLQTPASVRQYIEALEQALQELFARIEQQQQLINLQEKRIETFEKLAIFLILRF